MVVVNHVDLTIGDGEFFTLLGPSGCGKTTLLRMIAGFNDPDEGDILFDGESVLSLPAHKRDTGMVFQNYALFPHLSVADNVAYGLKARGIKGHELKERVATILEAVQLGGMEARYPRQLSGGQQQRVALARALVIRPRVLLMDEPLSNLDAKLRVSMREEIRRIQQNLGITTVYVTHDQEEAMAVSDRIAIFYAGHLQQVASPAAIYFSPANRFTAEFMGSCNILEPPALTSTPLPAWSEPRRGAGSSASLPKRPRREKRCTSCCARTGLSRQSRMRSTALRGQFAKECFLATASCIGLRRSGRRCG